MSLLVKFNLILILCFGIALVPAHLITQHLLQKNARTQIVQHARLMMETALATRGYTNKQIKPLLAARLAEEFLPQTVPAYSATEIFNYAARDEPRVHVQGSDAQSDEPPRPHGGLGGGRRQRLPRRTRSSRRSSASGTRRSGARSISPGRSRSPTRAASPATRRPR